jgi:hypothetical protein
MGSLCMKLIDLLKYSVLDASLDFTYTLTHGFVDGIHHPYDYSAVAEPVTVIAV